MRSGYYETQMLSLVKDFPHLRMRYLQCFALNYRWATGGHSDVIEWQLPSKLANFAKREQ